MADSTQYAATAGIGTAGALAGLRAADSDLANRLLVRWMTARPRRGQGDLRVPVYAELGRNLQSGSGEGIMASNIARMLNRHGIRSYYVNVLDHGRPGAWETPDVLANGELWAGENRISSGSLDRLGRIRASVKGRPSNALDAIAGRLADAGVSRDEALRLLRSGKFNGFTPGELLDTFKVIGNKGIADVASGRLPLMSRDAFLRRVSGGRLPYFLSGETGMSYNGIKRTSSGAYTNPVKFMTSLDPLGSGARNLGLDTQFSANYTAPRGGAFDPLIAGSRVYDPGLFRRNRFARRIVYGLDRRRMWDTVRRIAGENGIDPSTIGRGTKFMLISTGSAGSNAAEKLRLAGEAFKDDPNVRVIVQYGQPNPKGYAAGVNMVTPNGVMDEVNRLNKLRPGFILHTPRIDASEYGTLARTVDLHGGYAGSSSLTEALSHTNPTVFMNDSSLNRGNVAYGAARRGFKAIDSDVTAVKRLIDAGLPDSTSVGRDMTIGSILRNAGKTRADVAQTEADAIKALRDAMYNSKSRFDKGVVGDANRIIAEQTRRNRGVIESVQQAVLDRIGKNDARNYAKMRPGLEKLYVRLSRAVGRTAAGRRFGIPLALAGALGLGGGAYTLTNRRTK